MVWSQPVGTSVSGCIRELDHGRDAEVVDAVGAASVGGELRVHAGCGRCISGACLPAGPAEACGDTAKLSAGTGLSAWGPGMGSTRARGSASGDPTRAQGGAWSKRQHLHLI